VVISGLVNQLRSQLPSTAIAFAVLKAGIHISARAGVSSNGNSLPILLASCRGTMDPAFTGDARKIFDPPSYPTWPMTDRTSMILPWVNRNDTEEQASSADVAAFDRAVTLEDKRILESCEADVPLADTDGEEMHMRTDYPGVIMRRMFAKLLADHGETEQRAGG
jgi:hypothetical protein